MASEPYLILHKVRGQPAFDIAERIGVDDNDWIWIIPTSGHRAYPYWHKPLTDWYVANNGRFTVTMADAINIESMPTDLLDHYPTSKSQHDPQPTGSLAERLGLVPKTPPITRRP